jgi:S-DNA-T family DNA segregation ATPase FtsK/SpoIIIE
VDPLPALVPLSRLRDGGASPRTRQVNDDGSCERRRRIVVGVGGDHLEPVGCDRLGQGANALVAGPARSGRSTALRTLVVQLVEAGRPVVVLTARPSRLAGRRAPDPPGVESSPTVAAPLAVLGPSDADDLAALAGAHSDLVAVVDDAELFLDSPVEDLLVGIARGAERTGGGVLCAGTTTELAAMFRGITVEVRKQRLGILLNPAGYADGDLFGIRAPQGEDALPGRGLFVDGGEPIAIQVAIPA